MIENVCDIYIYNLIFSVMNLRMNKFYVNRNHRQNEGKKKLLYAPFQWGKIEKPLVLPKTLSRLEILILWRKFVTKNQRDDQHLPSLSGYALSHSHLAEGYQTHLPLTLPPPPTPRSSGPSWKSTGKIGKAEKWRRSLLTYPFPSQL